MKKSILFVNDEMCVGGVSKVLVNLLNMIDKDRYNIDLLVLHAHGDYMGDVPSYVNLIEGTSFFEVCDTPVKECLKNGKILNKINFYLRIKNGSIRKDINREVKKMGLKKYDVAIAFKEGFSSIFVSCLDANKKINWIHSDYSIKNYAANYMETMKLVLKEFDYNVAVSKKAADSFKDIFELDEVLTIHNILETDKILKLSQENVEYRDDCLTFVCVGRLHPQKAYDRLIRACAKLRLNYNIYILGEGEQRSELEALLKELDVDNVYLLGNKSNPYPYIKQADCLLLCSLYEGLPTVVYESLILHTPVLSTLVAGIDEQLMDKYGIIVNNDEEGLYEGLYNVINNPSVLNEYRDNLSDYKYENKEILESIYKLIDGGLWN